MHFTWQIASRISLRDIQEPERIGALIKIAWEVIILLYSWLSAINWTPGPDNSNLINTEYAVPINPENKAKIRYNVGVSLPMKLPSEPYVIVSHHTARHKVYF
uniref:Uncharacterized protein n=1 Tax=Morchella importuna TaxID=1174673 RepID=A0A650AGD6_9PEZI|nr:hypothetical protein [Morchella importuna]QGN66779.1 hypothetical protein [Morchella importuna]